MSLQLTVPDMCCDGCVRAITKIVQTLDSSAKVEADIQTKKVTIDSGAAKDKIVAALEKGGFPPE